MSTVMIHDWDFFHYQNVMPNLECAKFLSFAKSHRYITVLSPVFEPANYSKTFVRKDYDDGVFDERFFQPNISYGGRAFGNVYAPLKPDIEAAVPDMEEYERFFQYFGSGVAKYEQFNAIIHATHARLSLDGIHIDKFPTERLSKIHPSIILHDYDLGTIPGAYDFLYDLCNDISDTRQFRIGNKFPIMINDYTTFTKWIKLPSMYDCFYLQYNNLFTDEELIELMSQPNVTLMKIMYNPIAACQSDQDFVINILPQIYKQVLFLRSYDHRFLLNNDTTQLQTPELKNIINIIQSFYQRPKNKDGYINRFTLAAYCQWLKKNARRQRWTTTLEHQLTLDEMRQAFQYIRENNYELFTKFYSAAEAANDGGKLIYDRTRDSEANQ